MDEIFSQFNSMTSLNQTALICKLLAEGGRFLNLDNIIEELVRIYGHKVSEKAESFENDLAY